MTAAQPMSPVAPKTIAWFWDSDIVSELLSFSFEASRRAEAIAVFLSTFERHLDSVVTMAHPSTLPEAARRNGWVIEWLR